MRHSTSEAPTCVEYRWQCEEEGGRVIASVRSKNLAVGGGEWILREHRKDSSILKLPVWHVLKKLCSVFSRHLSIYIKSKNYNLLIFLPSLFHWEMNDTGLRSSAPPPHLHCRIRKIRGHGEGAHSLKPQSDPDFSLFNSALALNIRDDIHNVTFTKVCWQIYPVWLCESVVWCFVSLCKYASSGTVYRNLTAGLSWQFVD